MMSSRKAKPTTALGQRLVRDLEKRHAAGLKLNKNFPVAEEKASKNIPLERPKYAEPGQKKFKHLAEKLGVTALELFARRRFAVLYSDADLRRFCDRRMKLTEKPISWAAVKWLLRVACPEKRRELEGKIAKNDWSVSDLKAEIKLLQRPPRRAGRKVRPPKSPEAGLVILEGDADRLGKFLKAYLLVAQSPISKL